VRGSHVSWALDPPCFFKGVQSSVDALLSARRTHRVWLAGKTRVEMVDLKKSHVAVVPSVRSTKMRQSRLGKDPRHSDRGISRRLSSQTLSQHYTPS